MKDGKAKYEDGREVFVPVANGGRVSARVKTSYQGPDGKWLYAIKVTEGPTVDLLLANLPEDRILENRNS